jgi:hypothetical protein
MSLSTARFEIQLNASRHVYGTNIEVPLNQRRSECSFSILAPPGSLLSVS